MILLESTKTAAATGARMRRREEIDGRFKWNLNDIFPDWAAWEASYRTLETRVDEFAALKGTLASGPDALARAFGMSDELGQLAHKVWYYSSLRYDEDQRDNEMNAKRQQVQNLLARLGQASSWFNPELLRIPLETVRGWLDASPDLAPYRFAIED